MTFRPFLWCCTEVCFDDRLVDVWHGDWPGKLEEFSKDRYVYTETLDLLDSHAINGGAMYMYTIHLFLWGVKVDTSILIQKHFTLSFFSMSSSAPIRSYYQLSILTRVATGQWHLAFLWISVLLLLQPSSWKLHSLLLRRQRISEVSCTATSAQFLTTCVCVCVKHIHLQLTPPCYSNS
jgi:hypothetical protein